MRGACGRTARLEESCVGVEERDVARMLGLAREGRNDRGRELEDDEAIAAAGAKDEALLLAWVAMGAEMFGALDGPAAGCSETPATACGLCADCDGAGVVTGVDELA